LLNLAVSFEILMIGVAFVVATIYDNHHFDHPEFYLNDHEYMMLALYLVQSVALVNDLIQFHAIFTTLYVVIGIGFSVACSVAGMENYLVIRSLIVLLVGVIFGIIGSYFSCLSFIK
jgi:hypothetical protein